LFHQLQRALILLFDNGAVIVIVHERGVHVGDGQLREFCNDLLGSHALKVMPNMNVPHSNTRARDTRLAATYRTVNGDVTLLNSLVLSRSHNSIRPRLDFRWQGSAAIDHSVNRSRTEYA
jgi:hypothetical protein